MAHDTKNLHKAKRVKNDEFYTRYEDVEKELINYKEQLKGLWVYCPCDDYRWSNFYKYLKSNFNDFHLRHLTATNYDIGDGSYRCDFNGYEEVVTKMDGDGDFRSDECTNIMHNADIVITNPPFSLFREFLVWLNDKNFLILGAHNMCHYTVLFNLLKDEKVKIGGHKTHTLFRTPDVDDTDIGMTIWYTTLNTYQKEEYQPVNIEPGRKYDNYDAVDAKSTTIPANYDGLIGVPVSYICKPNHNYRLVDRINPMIDGKYIYKRLIIKRK